MSAYNDLAKEEQIKAAYNEYIAYLCIFDELEEGRGGKDGGGTSRAHAVEGNKNLQSSVAGVINPFNERV